MPDGARLEQSLTGVPIQPLSTSVSIRDAPKQKVNPGVPRPPSSNVPTGPDSNVPATPTKDVSGPISLQFGSISPNFMNGMQVPVRTSSAPPNVDEQNRNQVFVDSVKVMPALPNPSASSHPPEKIAEKVEQSNNTEGLGSGSVQSRSKRDVPVSSPPTQMHKPYPHPMTGIPRPIQFHTAQPQVPVQYGGHAQSQPHTLSASSLPIQMTVPLLVNPSLQQPMFVTGLPSHHPMPPQGIWQHGQGLGFSTSGINPHMPPPLGNMGMAIPSQFPQHQTAMYGSLRKTVKIIDPKTHEELRLDGSHPSIPLQSQPLPFQPASIHYYPNSYNNGSVIFQAPNNSQISQGTRLHNQVTIKPGPGTVGEKDQVPVKQSIRGRDELPLTSTSTGKDFQKHSESHEGGGSAEESVLDVIKEQQKKQDNKGPLAVQDQVAELPTSVSVSASHSVDDVNIRDCTLNDIDSKANDVERESSSESRDIKSEDGISTVAETFNQYDKDGKLCNASIHSTNISKTYPAFTCSESSELTNQTDESCLAQAASSSKTDDNHVETAQEKVNECATCSSEADSSLSSSLNANSNGAFLSIGLSTQDQHLVTYRSEASSKPIDGNSGNNHKVMDEKKEDIRHVDSVEGENNEGLNPCSAEVVEDVVLIKDGAHAKAESDDREDAARASRQNQGTFKKENQAVLEFKKHAEDGDEMRAKKYSRDFLLKFADKCKNLPEAFEIAADFSEALMVSDLGASVEQYHSPGRNIDHRRPGGFRIEHHTSGMGREDKRSKLPGPLMTGRDTQGGNFGGNRSNFAPTPLHYGGGSYLGPVGAQGGGMRRNGVDSGRWIQGTAFHKGLMHSPHTPSQVMHKAEKKYEVGKVTDEEQAKQRRLKAILNKLTPQNFEKLFQQVKDVNIDNVTTLSGVISQIFDKALMEPTFCQMYANFCFHLAAELPELTIDNETVTFKRLLLNKCQEEFERGKREEEEANLIDREGETKLSDEEREEKRLKARRRMLGNIRLIGELYKKKMLTERIMHECIQILLGESEGQNLDEENIEALCKLMSTIGEVIDHAKAKVHMDAYFAGMSNLSNNMKLSSRLRFMLKDAIDLRKNKWQQRRKVDGPKKIEEVHRDAAQERLTQTSRTSFGRRSQQLEYSPRGPSVLPSPSSQIGGFRPISPMRRDYGSQDARMDDKYTSQNRPLSLPLTQKGIGDHITLGPQGGLAKGLTFRATVSKISSASIQSAGNSNRVASSVDEFDPMLDRIPRDSREDALQSYVPERLSRRYDQTGKQDQIMLNGNRDQSLDTSLPTSHTVQNAVQDKAVPEERLQELSMSAIKEFYSARDEKEIALCVKDLKTPSFHSSMVSIWITDSFERKDMERALLEKLLVNLTKSQDVILTPDQLIHGFECVLATLEDAVNDAPRAAEFLGRIFARAVLESIVPMDRIGMLLLQGGEEERRLVETGLAADVLGTTLDTIKSDKGDSSLDELLRTSNLLLHDFRPPGSKNKSKLDKFLIP
ncbi:unnamed protein product [Cuscuta campestris]|uniref:Eukaryotic translation initiation factor 4G n=1 Tax=Cuscuta campestris TaxID=132261 RepID=A0A484N2S9_9ASTE|nr:unnamed protein product [Cuscuta campestris]